MTPRVASSRPALRPARRLAVGALAAVLATTVTVALAPSLTSPAGAAGPLAAQERPSYATSAERAQARQSRTPMVIAHRGASGYRPEHTLAAYDLAIRMGADYVEPDLVSTKDGVLVARHENEISGTTDVAQRPRFADRRTTKTIDGTAVTGWFTEDFTLRELRRLRAIERVPLIRPDNTRYDGRFQVPTLVEVLQLVAKQNRRPGKDVGVYIETKHPTYFDALGLSMEEPLVRTLRRQGFDRRGAKVYLQSFETANLRDLDRLTDLPLTQLMDATGAPYDLVAAGDPRTYADLTERRELRGIARYADAIGPNKDLVIPRRADGSADRRTALVGDAHEYGMRVHPFTFRDENQFMATDFRRGTDPNAKGDVRAEIAAFLDAGVDGFFADHPDSGVDARDAWLATNR